MRLSFLLKIVLGVVLLAVLSLVIVWGYSFEAGKTVSLQQRSFFEQFVVAGGAIVWFILLPMSFVAVYLVAEHSMTIRRSRLVPIGVGQQVLRTLRQVGLKNCSDQFQKNSDFVSVSIADALSCGGDWFRMRNTLFESIEAQAMRYMRRIEWLNLIGNVSPMVGLFGTVFGMIKLFNAIVIAGGQPQPAHLAEGISVALVTTFWGLFIAIPSLAIHGVFRNRIETFVSDAISESENILPQVQCFLKSQGQTQTTAGQQRIGQVPKKQAKTSQSPAQIR